MRGNRGDRAPGREEMGRVHVPTLRLGSRMRDQEPRLLQVVLWPEHRAHCGGDKRLCSELGKWRRLRRVHVLPPALAPILHLARFDRRELLAEPPPRLLVQDALDDADTTLTNVRADLRRGRSTRHLVLPCTRARLRTAAASPPLPAVREEGARERRRQERDGVAVGTSHDKAANSTSV